MFTLLLSIIFCAKLALSNSYLQQFNEVAKAESGYRRYLLQFVSVRAIHTKDICDASDKETIRTGIPEQVCAEECANAPYFCTSFLLGFQDQTLKCFHYAAKAANIVFLKFADDDVGLPDSGIWLHSLYEIKSEPDFVTTVAELSNKLINDDLSSRDWEDIVENYYTDPKWYDYDYVERFGQTCQEAIPFEQEIESINEKQALRLGGLDRKSFILALKMFHSPNPKYSPDFDKIILIFLKWYQPRGSDFSDTHYLAIDRQTQNRVFVHSFSSGHYVTITRGMDGYDHIAYISADSSFAQKDSNVQAAISKYQQSTDSLLGLADGTTKLSPHPRVEDKDDVDLSHLGSTRAERVQQTAIAVVGHLAAAMREGKHVFFKNPFDATLLRDLITFVLSWAYKIRQSDFNMLEEAEILNRASKMRKTLFTGFSPDSMLNVITQH